MSGELRLDQRIDLLSRTPAVLRAWLGGLDDAITNASYGPDTFGPYHVVGHLILGEQTDWIPRTRIILEHGTAQAFDPFDWAATIRPESGPPMGELLDQFETLRAQNLDTLRGLGLTAEDLAKRGTHPKLGEVTLDQMLSAWCVHDQHHIAQVSKTMGFLLRHAVGPWRPFVSSIPPDAPPER